MFCRAFTLALCALAVGFVFSAHAADIAKLDGPIIAVFDKPPDENMVGKQFGVFRNEDPKEEQFIECKWSELAAGRARERLGFLTLVYNVSGAGKYNGWWLKLGGADWTQYQNGDLVLLLRRLNPGPRSFKVELKTKSEDGQSRSAGFVQNLSRSQLAQQARVGYLELRIPLKEFGLNLNRVDEVVIVFENNRLQRSEQRALGIRAIAVTSKRGQPLEQIIYDADRLLDELGRKSFDWFMKGRHPETGLVLDRFPNRKGVTLSPDTGAMCSVASVGYYLSLLPEWARLGYIPRDEASNEARKTLQFVLDHVEHHDGVLYHFVDWQTGKRWGKSEVSTLDTAILLNGAMVVASAFGGDIARLADDLLDRADWPAFVVEHPASGKKKLLSLGWAPEKGLLHPADVRSSEMAMPYFLAVGSKQPIDAELWYNTTIDYYEIAERQVLNAQHPLFTSYFGLGWHQLKGLVDRDKVDLDGNAKLAAQLNRYLCRRKGGDCATYAVDFGGWWGISAGDAPTGYVAPGPMGDDADCVVWPMTALAALPWIPDVMKVDLVQWRKSPLWPNVDGEFGLRPFRKDLDDLKREWYGEDLIGIDVGAFAVSLANYRAGTVWKYWQQHPVAKAAYLRLGIAKK